ncbi:MAG: SDR family NAD(P)-dependent oxidoreductase, partial [Acidimicrobiia bacterium]
MKLQDRVTLVIGGASGIGRASAEVCAAEGARVMVADINEEGAKEVAAGIRAQGGSAAVVMCDITSEDAVRGSVDATAAEFGRLDGLITSPGVGGAPGPGDRWDRSLEMLLKGPFYACKYALQQMERDGSGAIVNISSLAGV